VLVGLALVMLRIILLLVEAAYILCLAEGRRKRTGWNSPARLNGCGASHSEHAAISKRRDRVTLEKHPRSSSHHPCQVYAFPYT
jgi:hypothetical protein